MAGRQEKSRPVGRLLLANDQLGDDRRITSSLITSSFRKWPSKDMTHRAVVSTFAPNPFISVKPSPCPHRTSIWSPARCTKLGSGILAEDGFLADSLIHWRQFLLASRYASCSGGTPPQDTRSTPATIAMATVARVIRVLIAILVSVSVEDSRTLPGPQQTATPAPPQIPCTR